MRVRRLEMLEVQAIDVVLSFIAIGMFVAFLGHVRDWPDEKLEELLGVRHGR